MTNTRRTKTVVFVLLGVAAVCMMVATPCIGMGVLGLLGVLADVGSAENRSMGLESLRIAAIPFGIGVVVLFVAYVVWRRDAARIVNKD